MEQIKSFQIFKDMALGNGAFSEVYQACCNDLPCAAKILQDSIPDHHNLPSDAHATKIFQDSAPGHQFPCIEDFSSGSTKTGGTRQHCKKPQDYVEDSKNLHSPRKSLHSPQNAETVAEDHNSLGEQEEQEATGVPLDGQVMVMESLIMKQVRHPCIIQFLGLVVDPDSRQPAILMELATETLTSFLSHTQPLRLHQQTAISGDVACGLAYLHQHHILHRDISSNNVLMVSPTKAKLSDFGVATVILPENTPRNMRALPGTVEYMPPEAAPCDGSFSASYSYPLDIFSLGVLMVQTCTGKQPKPCPALKQWRGNIEPKALGRNGGQKERVWEKLSEVERRGAHLKLIADDHPLKTLALHCLRDTAAFRPTAPQIWERVQHIM